MSASAYRRQAVGDHKCGAVLALGGPRPLGSDAQFALSTDAVASSRSRIGVDSSAELVQWIGVGAHPPDSLTPRSPDNGI